MFALIYYAITLYQLHFLLQLFCICLYALAKECYFWTLGMEVDRFKKLSSSFVHPFFDA